MNLQRAKQLFDKNTEQNEVYFTSDGFPFFNKAQAESHASRLEKREIETIAREQANEAAPGATEPETNFKSKNKKK